MDNGIRIVKSEFKEKLELVFESYAHRTFNNRQIEEICYRMYLCSKCIERGICEVCGCNVINSLSEPMACNTEKFPNFFRTNEEWEEFKTLNNIEVI